MEAKNMKVISLMVIVMLGMFAEKSSAFSEVCYVGCLVQCGFTHRHDHKAIFRCPLSCLGKCIFEWKSPTGETSTTTHNHYCKLGCAASNCIKKSTLKDPRGYEVERCVNSFCHNQCTN
ncbi:hypothetical protein MKW94_021595 [Papaver nudicaule]|uniref:Thionin-like protein 2 n=1 Tax=Papaver nudicaule TaxID=74823 RepID=A0AA41W1F3_PAPNU|nr:hypothetical protein [Papaver nudicaule]